MKNDNLSVKSSAKDVFLYLLMVIMLAVGVGFFITLVWQYINIKLPDPIEFYRQGAFNLMRSAISALVIVWPVLILSSWMIKKDLYSINEKRNIWVRKWLLYLTLFVASLTVIINLISLTNSFLGGELTMRFFLKVATVLLVAVGVFAFYLWELRRDVEKKTNVHRIVCALSFVLVTGWVVAGLLVVGTPSGQRMVRFDEMRVNDLSSIQNEVLAHWIQKGTLPETLDKVADSISGYIVPVDPETGEAYKYRPTGDLTFELCANFTTSLESSDTQRDIAIPRNAYYSDFGGGALSWDHDLGEQCFERKIDPDLYKDQTQLPR